MKSKEINYTFFRKVLIKLLYMRWTIMIPTRLYLRIMFRITNGYKLSLSNPKTFNEKSQWMKLNFYDESYKVFVDKYTSKSTVEKILGTDENIIDNYGVWNNSNEIDFDSLPNSFVLKCTHDSGGVFVVEDKSKIDIKNIKRKLNKQMSKNYYRISKEWIYKDIKPRIIAERLLIPETDEQIFDYKFFCFNGEPKLLYIASDRNIQDTKFDFYDLDFNRLKIKNYYPNTKDEFIKPNNFSNMVDMARKLSQGFHHVRIDLYNVNGKIYFGEFTFFHFSGFKPFFPYFWDQKLGEWLVLPIKDI